MQNVEDEARNGGCAGTDKSFPHTASNFKILIPQPFKNITVWITRSRSYYQSQPLSTAFLLFSPLGSGDFESEIRACPRDPRVGELARAAGSGSVGGCVRGSSPLEETPRGIFG